MENQKVVINNEYDYSNIIQSVEVVSYLVQYCDNTNKELIKLITSAEEKNKQFKLEYKDYMYKKSYGHCFEMTYD